MADNFTIGTNYEIGLIGPDKLATLVGDDPLMKLNPPTYSDTSLVMWEQPEDGYGLLSLRGLNGDPPTSDVPGYRRMKMAPGYYGEKVVIGEQEMTEAREFGTPNEPMDMEKRIGYIQDQILKRAVDRMRLVTSEFYRTGKFLVVSPDGRITHADIMEGYATRNVFSPAIGWAANPAAATPIDDLLSYQTALQLGTDSVFDENTELLCSTPTINDLMATYQIRNQIKLDYGNTPIGLKATNDILKGYGLPSIRRYDEDYYATKAAAKARTGAIRFIPHKSLIWAGRRKDGAQAAAFQMTRSAVKNPPAGVAQNAPGYKWSPEGRSGLASDIDKGLYTLIQYQLMPPQYTIDIGFNGGIAVRFPSAFAGISYT